MKVEFKNYAYTFSVTVIVFFFLSQILTVLGWVCNMKVQAWQLPCYLLLTLLLMYFSNFNKIGKNKNYCYYCLYFLGILFFLGIINFYILDGQFDSFWYHKPIIFSLKNGWNPIYQKFSPFFPIGHFRVQHFPIGAEIVQSLFYATTNFIEIGKITNVLSTLALFAYSYYFLSSFLKFSNKLIIIFTFLITLNPFVIFLMFTYMNDGQIYNTSLLLGMSLFQYLKNKSKSSLLFSCMCLILLLGIKITSIIFVFFIVLFIILLALYYKEYQVIRNLVLFFSLSSLCGFFMLNYHPYTKNFFYYKNPFYPLTLSDSVDIKDLKNSQRINYNSNGFLNFVTTITTVELSAKDSIHKLRIPNLKKNIRQPFKNIPIVSITRFPFQFNKINFKSQGHYTQPFGIIFLEIFIFSLCFILYLFFENKLPKKNKFIVLLGIILILISCILNPQFWNFRFILELWLVPVILLMYLFAEPVSGVTKFIRNFLFILILINVFWMGVLNSFIFKRSYAERKQLFKLKSSSLMIDTFNVQLKPHFLSSHTQMVLLKLHENNVHYTFKNYSMNDSCYILLNSYILYK